MISLLILACLIIIGACSIAGLGASRWRQRAHDRKEMAWEVERRALLDRIMVLAGHGEYVPEITLPPEEPRIPDLILDPGDMPYAEISVP